MTGDGDITGAGKQQGDCQLRHGVGGGARGVLHHEAVLLGVLHSDVVHADAGADDDLQLAALGSIDLRLFDLGGTADNDHVKLTECCAQLIGLIELLNDFKTVCPQLSHGRSVHTVSNKNTHRYFLLIKWKCSCFVVGGDAHIAPPFNGMLSYVVRADVGIGPYEISRA